jgi:soluble cytochrome b562
MSVTGITSINSAQLANFQSNFQKVQSEFKQLGQDLQSGNLTQAQADFVTLSQSLASPPNFVGPNAVTQSPQAQSASNSHHSSHHRVHLHQALSQLGQALQAGNLSAAQQAFATMQQIWQQFGSSASSSTSSTQTTPVNVTA